MAEALVGILMGSRSDWEAMKNCCQTLESLGVPHEVNVLSAHRTPEAVAQYARSAEGRGLQIIIAAAGCAAHLAGVVASGTVLPVLGVPMESKGLGGMDSLLSTVQMPGGIPVGTLAIGKAGAVNSAILAAQMLGIAKPSYREAVRNFRKKQSEELLKNTDPRA